MLESSLKKSRASRSGQVKNDIKIQFFGRQKCLAKVLFSARGQGFYVINQRKIFGNFLRTSALLRHIFIFCHILSNLSLSLYLWKVALFCSLKVLLHKWRFFKGGDKNGKLWFHRKLADGLLLNYSIVWAK